MRPRASWSRHFLLLGGRAKFGANRGEDFELISGANTASNPDEIEVIEFFLTDVSIAEILRNHRGVVRRDPEHAKFSRIPADFSPTWALLGQAYLTLAEMGDLGTQHDAMFSAVHDRGMTFRSGEK